MEDLYIPAWVHEDRKPSIAYDSHVEAATIEAVLIG
jgi:hypothetical protein